MKNWHLYILRVLIKLAFIGVKRLDAKQGVIKESFHWCSGWVCSAREWGLASGLVSLVAMQGHADGTLKFALLFWSAFYLGQFGRWTIGSLFPTLLFWFLTENYHIVQSSPYTVNIPNTSIIYQMALARKGALASIVMFLPWGSLDCICDFLGCNYLKEVVLRSSCMCLAAVKF